MKKILSMFLLAVLVACGNGDPVGRPSPSQLHVQVLDSAGTPVPGAHVGVSYRFADSFPVPAAAADVPPAPLRTAMAQNSPNPFDFNVTRIQFTKAKEGAAQVHLLDRSGDPVATLFDDVVPAGVYETVVRGTDIPNGRYRVQLESQDGDSTVTLGIDIFHQDDDPGRLENTYLGVTDGQGRFDVFMNDLSIGGLIFLTRPSSPDIYGENAVLSSIRVDVWSDVLGTPRTASAEVDIANWSPNATLEVTLR